MRSGPAAHSISKCEGFSLLEVLVTVLVLSLGILGLSGLQVTAMKNSYSALLRAQAAQYGYDIVDRMRVNRQQAITEGYVLDMGATTSTKSGLAKADVDEWLAQVSAALPSGEADIKVTADGVATVIIKWNESAMGNTLTHSECPPPQTKGEVCFRLVTEL